MSPELSMSLFQQRFLYPSSGGQASCQNLRNEMFETFSIGQVLILCFSPSLDYKKDLFEGERMACASSDEGIVDNLFLNFDTDKEDDTEDMLKYEWLIFVINLGIYMFCPYSRLDENSKDQMKEKWLQYREQRLDNVPLDEQDNKGLSILQKRRRVPKKRGRKKLQILQNESWLQNHIRNNLDI